MNKKDSVGICFIGKNNYNDFISNFLGKKPGSILDEHGEKLGNHQAKIFGYILHLLIQEI